MLWAKGKFLKKYTKPSLARSIIAFSVLILAVYAVLMINRGLHGHEKSISDAKFHSDKLIHILSDHVELTFLAADLNLRRAVERQHFNRLFGKNLWQDMKNYFALWVDETPQITSMLMTDKNGIIELNYSAEGVTGPFDTKRNLKGESFFTSHWQAENPELLFIEAKEFDGNKFVVMSRGLYNVNGRFDGVVVTVVDVRYILDFFRSLESASETKFILMRNDNQLLINQLQKASEINLLNRMVLEDASSKGIFSDSTQVVKEQADDNKLRIYSFKHIPNLDMIVSVVMAHDDIFAEWYASRKYDAFFLVAFALFVLVISYFAIAMSKQVKKVKMSESAAILASQAKSDFLANMSHELRTPLNAIIGFSEMLDSGYFGKLNAKQKERIHDINLCGNHLLELISDILEFSKGEAGKLEMREEKFSIQNIIAESVRIMNARSKKSGVIIINNTPTELPLLMADSRKIRQTLLNLLSNAVKFTHEGGTVEINCKVEGALLITITDTGIGMPEEDIPKALSIFGQVHNDPSYGGTGLGLPLCKMFIELHGGTLSVQSLEGVGTRVSISLPIERLMASHPQNVHEITPSRTVETTPKQAIVNEL